MNAKPTITITHSQANILIQTLEGCIKEMFSEFDSSLQCDSQARQVLSHLLVKRHWKIPVDSVILIPPRHSLIFIDVRRYEAMLYPLLKTPSEPWCIVLG